MADEKPAVELLTALFEVQRSAEALSKDASNPHFKSNYVDVNSLLEAIKPLLQKNGILLVQSPTEPPAGSITADGSTPLALTTSLIHVSTGQTMSSTLVMPLAKTDPQGYGSAITYARRYALIAMLALEQEDDDGNAASKPRPTFNRPTSSTPAPKKTEEPKGEDEKPADDKKVEAPAKKAGTLWGGRK